MIEFKGVHKVYDNGTKALKDVNLRIDKGEFVFIVGASGAGKSTFLKLIMREEVANAGEVIVNDFKLSKLKRREIPYLRRTMGIVFQDFRLINNMNVFDNVAFAMRVIGASQRRTFWGWWGCRIRRGTIPWSCRAASSSGWVWPGRW